ncbi:hypothetical protein JFL43_11995 [Viridibacillus sp. YIM B01967]|uniref:Signal transduction histidine kinase 5TM receptor LytS transmembrane region domain-containing protein n=1 Tax=Viridibacillus soli TaxID=2798301 RepID=A0ABS1H813_9BACL|nr:hypothetical protein [Viridibacillus soli]
MFELFITMLERLGIIVMIAFILTRLKFLRGLIVQKKFSNRQQWMSILFFGFFGVIGTYSGMTLSIETQQFDRWASELSADEAIANSRVIGVVIAGLLGGDKVGIIAGVRRLTLGGFTAIPCGTASILASAIHSLALLLMGKPIDSGDCIMGCDDVFILNEEKLLDFAYSRYIYDDDDSDIYLKCTN